MPHLEPSRNRFRDSRSPSGSGTGSNAWTRSPTVPKGVSFCSLIGQQVLRLPEQSRALFGEARYSSSAAFTSSPFKRRSKTFDDPKAARRPPRLRKVSRNHTPRWFTGKR